MPDDANLSPDPRRDGDARAGSRRHTRRLRRGSADSHTNPATSRKRQTRFSRIDNDEAVLSPARDEARLEEAVLRHDFDVKGRHKAELFAKDAPATVNNFVFLAREGFYTNVKFHRIIAGFMVQTGDPTGTGTGGPGYRFKDEPVTRKYSRGTLAMANAGPNTNGSQFFIMHADYALQPNYTIFGQVTVGPRRAGQDRDRPGHRQPHRREVGADRGRADQVASRSRRSRESSLTPCPPSRTREGDTTSPWLRHPSPFRRGTSR